jgi:6-phosphogluconolactonase
MAGPQTLLNQSIYLISGEAEFYACAAKRFVERAQTAIKARGRFTVALSGGSTPKGIYSLLAQEEKYRNAVDWTKVGFFWGDERHVPPDHPDSNFRMANETMLSKLPIDAAKQVFRIKSEMTDAAEAADDYEAILRRELSATGGWPEFDLMMLGMGAEGHTLSLFPGTKALQEKTRWVTSNWVGKLYTDRITMTAPLANNAGTVEFLIRGTDKQAALKAVLEGPDEPDQLPAQLIKPLKAPLEWLIGEEAAGMLSTDIKEKFSAAGLRNLVKESV